MLWDDQGINEGEKLNIGDAWAQVSQSKNQQAASMAVALYVSLAEQLKKESLPVGTRELDDRHAEMHAKAMKEMRAHSIGDDLEAFIVSAP